MLIISIIRTLCKKLPQHSWIRAIIGFNGLQSYERYNEIAKLLPRCNATKVLDIGSGGCSPLVEVCPKVLSLDIINKKGVDIVADASHLPFRYNAFDCIVAVDMLEHLKRNERAQAIQEMKKVGRLVIVHVPLNDNDKFMARTADLLFYNFVKHRLGYNEKNTLEHLKCGYPTPAEIEVTGFKMVKPDWNFKVWLITAKLHYVSRGILAPLVIILYLALLKKIQNPPWWGAYFIYNG
jgi:SAM-dependent methyltransferase